MDKNAIAALGISETDPKKILEQLEEMQLDLEQRLESASDEARIAQLQEKLDRVEAQLKIVREEVKKAAEAPAPKAEEKKGALPVTVSQNRFKQSNQGALPKTYKPEDKKKATSGPSEKESKKHEEDLERRAKELASEMKAKHKEEVKAAKKEDKKREELSKEDGKKAAAASATVGTAAGAATSATGATVGGTGAGTGTATPKDELEKKLKDGVAAFYHSDFAKAYNLLKEVANRGDDVKMEDKDRGMAEHLVGMMHKQGLGGAKKDEKEAIFWFKTSAKHGNPDGCMEVAMYYANQKSSSASEVQQNIKNSLKFFELADKNGNKVAASKYVDKVILQINEVSLAQKIKARKYLDAMIASEKDEYAKSVLKDKKKSISLFGGSTAKVDSNGKTVKIKKKAMKGFFDYLAVIGAVIYVIGCMYVVKEFDLGGVLSFPFLSDVYGFKLCPGFVWDLLGRVYNAIRGIQFVFLGALLCALSDYTDRGWIANLICETAFFISMALVVILAFFEIGNLEFIHLVGFSLIAAVVGRVIGAIVGSFTGGR